MEKASSLVVPQGQVKLTQPLSAHGPYYPLEVSLLGGRKKMCLPRREKGPYTLITMGPIRPLRRQPCLESRKLWAEPKALQGITQMHLTHSI